MLKNLALIALAGAAGTLARFGLSCGVDHLWRTHFPWGTYAVNAAGSLLAGFAWMAFEQHSGWRDDHATLFFVGFLGAFTTFSSVMLDAAKLLHQGAFWSAAGMLAAQVLTGIGAALLGIGGAKLIWG